MAQTDSKNQEINNQILNLLRSTHARIHEQLPAEHLELISARSLGKARELIAEFESSPKLLDAYLQSHLDALIQIYFSQEAGSSIASLCSACVYELCKVRSYKFVVNFLSNDVQTGQRIIERLKHPGVGEHEIYFLLLWLSSFAIVPFPLDNIVAGLQSYLYHLAIRNLQKYGSASMTQKLSAVLLSRLLLRSDGKDMLLGYVNECCSNWSELDHGEKLGHLMALKSILKQSSSATVAELAPKIYEDVAMVDLMSIKYSVDSSIPNTNVILLIAILSRLAKFHILSSEYVKVSAIVNNLINDIFSPMASRFDVSLREAMAKSLSKIVSFLRLRAVNYAQQLIWYATRQLRIGELETCSSQYIHDITIDSSNLSVAKFHTILLFYGFLGLSRSIDVQFVPTLLSVVNKTLFLANYQYPIVQGSQLRDASCFCLWSLFRSLSPDDFKEVAEDITMIHDVWVNIIRVLLLDEDYTIRRCAIPVMQEFVGRFGSLLPITFSNMNEGKHLVETTAMLVDTDKCVSAKDIIDHGYSSKLFVPHIVQALASGNCSFSYFLRLSGILLELLNEEAVRKEPVCAFLTSSQETDMVHMLLDSLKVGNIMCLITLGELLRSGYLDCNMSKAILMDVQTISSNHHDPIFKRISLLFWYSSCIIAGVKEKGVQRKFWSIWISVSSNEASAKGDLKLLMHKCMEAVSLVPIDTDTFNDICKRLRYGNMMIAGLIPWNILTEDQLEQQLSIISDTKVDAETRATLIESNPRLTVTGEGSTVYRPSFPLLDLLDDYTLTNKGDVGSKVRLACLKHYREFIGGRPQELNLRKKSARLAGESLDSVRAMAFAILYGYNPHDVRTMTYSAYFHKLFQLHATLEPEVKESFWEGVVHSLAGVKVSSVLANEAFKQFLIWYENASHSERETALGTLLRQLKLPKPFVQLEARQQKTILATVALFVKLFEASIALSETFNYTALFIRAYNLQLGSTSAVRTGPVLQILSHLSLSKGEVASKARQRIVQIFSTAKTTAIRHLAQRALFEVVNDLAPTNEQLLRFTHESVNLSPQDYKKLESQLLCI
ncbi:hypothetical protein CJJ07_003960 [Candidozyma auris]|nr:hypothetical protein CJJ07_003960 [[Candida] auris]QEL59393.1 hypothetical protein CJJ09_001470 [[Candida] auris]